MAAMTFPHERLGRSRGSIDRAGQLLREWYESGVLAGPEVQEASATLNDYRSQIKDPLKRVVMGLRSAVRTSRADVVVSERLKRQPRIIAKLTRFPNMELTRMQDIGGCRAILPDLASVDAVRRRVERQTSQVMRVNDYNLDVPTSGYRAVHIAVRREGALIEIQLRTEWQQRWAKLVEDLDASYRLNLKNEDGPEEVLEYLRAYGSSLAELDRTGHVEPAQVRLVGRLREHAQRRLAAGGIG